MAAPTNYTPNNTLPYPPVQKLYLALYNGDPTDTDFGDEITGNGYKRQEIKWVKTNLNYSPDTILTVYNSQVVSYQQAKEEWGKITHFGFYDAPTGGNLLGYGTVTNPPFVRAGDSLVIKRAGLKVKLTWLSALEAFVAMLADGTATLEVIHYKSVFDPTDPVDPTDPPTSPEGFLLINEEGDLLLIDDGESYLIV